MSKDIIIDILIPLITAVFGFFGGIHYERYQSKQKVSGNNYGNMAGRDIKNVHNKK